MIFFSYFNQGKSFILNKTGLKLSEKSKYFYIHSHYNLANFNSLNQKAFKIFQKNEKG